LKQSDYNTPDVQGPTPNVERLGGLSGHHIVRAGVGSGSKREGAKKERNVRQKERERDHTGCSESKVRARSACSELIIISRQHQRV
jgi:hypothetical protein